MNTQNSTHCPSNSSKMKTISWHSSEPTIYSSRPPKYQPSFSYSQIMKPTKPITPTTSHNRHERRIHTPNLSATNLVSPSQEKKWETIAPAKDLVMISATSLTLKNGKERRLSRMFPHPIKRSNIRGSVKFAGLLIPVTWISNLAYYSYYFPVMWSQQPN